MHAQPLITDNQAVIYNVSACTVGLVFSCGLVNSPSMQIYRLPLNVSDI